MPRPKKEDMTNSVLPMSFYEQREKDNEKVRAEFKCMIPLGGHTCFYFKKYAGDPIEKYEFHDGEVYEIPRMVYDHIRENCFEKVPANALDKNGSPIRTIGKKVKRFEFIRVD